MGAFDASIPYDKAVYIGAWDHVLRSSVYVKLIPVETDTGSMSFALLAHRLLSKTKTDCIKTKSAEKP